MKKKKTTEKDQKIARVAKIYVILFFVSLKEKKKNVTSINFDYWLLFNFFKNA